MTPPDDVDGDDVDEDGADTAPEELEEAFEEELEHAEAARAPGRPNAFLRLYRGQTSIDFIGRRWWWIGLSSLIIVAGLLSLGTRGLNAGIDFKGGQSWTVQSQTLTVSAATSAVEAAGVPSPTVVQLTNHLNGQKTIQVTADLNHESADAIKNLEGSVAQALASAAHVSTTTVSFENVGATWGSNVTHRAIEALIVFLLAVILYISVRFEFKMAVAAIIAVIHDVLVTVGIYSLTGFQVTPDTVIAVLTVLGYSLYDTVVVFDRIRENSQGLGASGRITYSEMVNLSMNQTLARSINTSLVAIIPVFSVLVIGAFLLGATTLENFGLALVIGLTSGAYSSIFIASPLLAMMKEREPRYVTIRQRIETRGDRVGALTPAMAAAMAGAGGGAGRGGRSRPAASGVIRPGASQRAASVPAAASGDRPAPAGSGGGASRPSASGRPAGTRPPPRPRKKGKGKKR